jgi:hypothetical protein
VTDEKDNLKEKFLGTSEEETSSEKIDDKGL